MISIEKAKKLRKFIETAVQTGLTNEEGLEAKELYPKWSSFIGKELPANTKVFHEGNLWVVRQKIDNVLPNWAPSTDTAALYARLDETHAGTVEDPIPYDVNLAVYNGKYYIENDIIYKCIRDSGNPLYASCASLIGNYFELYITETPIEQHEELPSTGEGKEEPQEPSTTEETQEAIADFVQPDSTNPYKTGNRVKFNGKIYESKIDNNVWSPATYPDGWKLVVE